MIEAGWGERHPLARGGWCRRFVPREFVLVYAPRGEEEVGIVMRIVEAGVWWVAGIEVGEGKGEGERMEVEIGGGMGTAEGCGLGGEKGVETMVREA